MDNSRGFASQLALAPNHYTWKFEISSLLTVQYNTVK